MVKLSLPPDDYSLLHQMSSQELRLPEQMVRWLIRQEALKRGLAARRQQSIENSKSASVKVCETHDTTGAFAEINS